MTKTLIAKTSIFKAFAAVCIFGIGISGCTSKKKDSYGNNRYNRKRTNHAGGYLHQEPVKGSIASALMKKMELLSR